ncbi:hypothetical protein G7Y89_g6105 [Cudoniella acicularis]|uniref:Zn(2)-C6 fungal-type domain-containing protein n=1 Tax=Cudoniella acicularis TaxID=354080 RepID=A0A8H4W364_9HELO|nr:hypothetical protein G7Y89_g6105 [Cudoniella acicularis]
MPPVQQAANCSAEAGGTESGVRFDLGAGSHPNSSISKSALASLPRSPLQTIAEFPAVVIIRRPPNQIWCKDCNKRLNLLAPDIPLDPQNISSRFSTGSTLTLPSSPATSRVSSASQTKQAIPSHHIKHLDPYRHQPVRFEKRPGCATVSRTKIPATVSSCDETKPTCNQCAKSRRQCPGYKDDFDLVFRNETQATERRARRALTGKRANPQITLANQRTVMTNGGDGSMSLITPTSDTDTGMMLATPALTIPVEQQAPCFFMSNYVIAPSEGQSRGYFEFLHPLMKNDGPDTQLKLAFSAVSMASLANRPSSRGRKELSHLAVAQYSKALKATNLALQDPALQKSDQTLAAILMLGFYEKTVSSTSTNANAWFSHVDGAVTLVKLRGKKQLRTKVGHALFQVVRTQMAINCMSSSKAPAMGPDWWTSDATEGDFGIPVTKLNLQLAELRAEINASLTAFPRTPEYFQKVLDLMRRATSMEQQYQDWEESLPDFWRPKTVAWVDNLTGTDMTKSEVCPGKVDVYHNIWVATTWNYARVARLNISGTVMRCAAWICSPVDYRTTPEYATNVRLSVDLITDVIASTPFFLGWNIGQGGSMAASDYQSFQDRLENFTKPKPIGGFFALWPLFAVSCMDFVTDSQRAWVKGRMHYISESMGMNHAKVLAGFQIRLPSMIIRRDSMGSVPPSSQMMAAAVARGAYSPPTAAVTNPNTQNTMSSPQDGYVSNPNPSIPLRNVSTAVATSSSNAYTLNPLQQREAMQREAYEKERISLLKKGAGGQGEVMEALIAHYLHV